jgi:regulator of replication initiation timing
MHTTPARKQIKQLKAEVEELEREARTLRKVKKMQPGASERLTEAKRLRSEAGELESQARLEDLQLWKDVKHKTTKKGELKRYEYWHASWREGSRVRNVYLGSCRKMTREEALQKARSLKADALGV